ncbi:MAG TPA: MmcQ/YjbR family DNA-binding protein [Gemmatimonadales bacterium]|nr:MmcQ/YjbR family DNA-binding protein [Gemmatimonadales bacterium]
MPVTAAEFRRIALKLPEAIESAHLGHPDFRVAGKIFASLGYPSAEWAMVKLPPDEQEFFVKTEPEAFVPAKGVWGRQGSTSVRLSAARRDAVREALAIAWRSRAPGRLVTNPGS